MLAEDADRVDDRIDARELRQPVARGQVAREIGLHRRCAGIDVAARFDDDVPRGAQRAGEVTADEAARAGQ